MTTYTSDIIRDRTLCDLLNAIDAACERLTDTREHFVDLQDAAYAAGDVLAAAADYLQELREERLLQKGSITAVKTQGRNAMTLQTPDDRRETDSFNIADRKIEKLLRRLNDKNVCPCCAARAMAYHAACLAEVATGSAIAIEMFEGIVDHMRENNVPAPEPLPSTQAH